MTYRDLQYLFRKILTSLTNLTTIERNKKIALTDWRVLPDQTPSDDWINYRQALRDLPASASPKLNSDYELDSTSFTWPTEPE